MTNFGADTPFILLAKITVKEDKVSEYLELADKTDKAVEAVEPGMLHHTFDQDPENPLIFVWSEAYKNDEAFIAHLANPAVVNIYKNIQNLRMILLLKYMEQLGISVSK